MKVSKDCEDTVKNTWKIMGCYTKFLVIVGKAKNKKTSRRRKKSVKMRSQVYRGLPPDWYLEYSNCGHFE